MTMSKDNDPEWKKHFGDHSLPEVLRALADLIEESDKKRVGASGS